MSLTVCRECGTAVPAHAHACPTCGAVMAPAPAPAAAYRPAPRRPQEPERPWWRTAGGWMTAAGWMVIVAACLLFARSAVRASAAADRRKAEEAEVAREQQHLRAVLTWVRDTSASAPVPESAGRPVPASDPAKRMWVISRMLVDRSVWEREIMKRHGADGTMRMQAWLTRRYQANARAYPAVGKYLEGRVAAITEIEKTFAAWMEARVAALARESGMSAGEVREILPPDFGSRASADAAEAAAMLEVHRHLVRVDPRVRDAGDDLPRWEREEDWRRMEELGDRLNEAIAASDQARGRNLAMERALLGATE